MTADEILDVLDKLHALRHVRAISPEDYTARKAFLLDLLDGAIGFDAPSPSDAPHVADGAKDEDSSDEGSGTGVRSAPEDVGNRRHAPGISPNVAVAMLLVIAAIVGVIAFTLGRSVPVDEPAAGQPATAVSVPGAAGG